MSDLPVVRVIGFSRRRRHPYGVERFMQISYIGLDELQERMADKTLGIQAIRVLLAMIASCEYENRVRASQKDLARHLDMAQSSVARAVAALIDAGFVERPTSSRGYYVISPRLCWKGGEESLRAALQERGMLDANGLLAARAA